MVLETTKEPKLTPVSESALLVEFDNVISAEVSTQVLNLKGAIEKSNIVGVDECVAGFRSLLVHYNCLKISLVELKRSISLLFENNQLEDLEVKTWRVPVNYQGEAAVDLDEVARLHNLDTADVIRFHKESDFRVFMVGFAPGWCYLGGLNPKLATSRLESPRLKVPKGCISIGGQQGMIGGQAMPSGWRLLGQTPVQTYAPTRKPPFFIEVGDRIQFYEVDKTEFKKLQKAADKGEFVAQEVS